MLPLEIERETRSLKTTCLKSEKSKLTDPGPRVTRRAESPNIWMGAPVLLGVVPGTRKAAALKKRSGPRSSCTCRGSPGTRSGTLNVLKMGGSRLVRISVGKPPRRVVMPLICQPPRMWDTAEFELSHRFPRPHGSSYP